MKTCNNCEHWNESDKTCRRNPPLVWATSDGRGTCGFPTSLPDWFCSQFRAAKPTTIRLVSDESKPE